MTPERITELAAVLRDSVWAGEVTGDQSRVYAALADLVEETAARHTGREPWWEHKPDELVCTVCGDSESYGNADDWPCEELKQWSRLADLLGPERAS